MFHDGCTFPVSQVKTWLDSTIGHCCMAHDYALDHSIDIATFIAANWEFFGCSIAVNPVIGVITGLAVASPVAWALYRRGPKRPA